MGRLVRTACSGFECVLHVTNSRALLFLRNAIACLDNLPFSNLLSVSFCYSARSHIAFDCSMRI
jgi:hypothetical protein